MNRTSPFFSSKFFAGKVFRIACSLFVFAFSQNAVGQTAPEAVALEIGAAVEREIAGGQKQTFQIAFAADRYAKINVEQVGVDVVVKMLDANGKTLAEYDSEWRTQGAETIELTTGAAAGNYRLEVAAKYKLLPAGRYKINFTETRPATDKDRTLEEARRLYNEAVNLRRAGKAAEAVPVAARALEIRERNLDGEHADIASALNLLGNLYNDTNDYEKAEAAYRRALAIRTKILGEANPLVALTLGDLGVVYRLRGEPERAEPLYRQALAIREQTFGKEHPEVARNLQSIGNLYLDDGDYIEAEKIYLQVLAIREKTLEATNAAVASTLNALALIYNELGDNVKAETMYLRALDIGEKTLPPEHPSIAIYLDNLAGTYREMGDFARAEPMLKRALAIREKTLGAEDLMVSASLNNVGNFYQDKKDYAEAEKAYSRSLQIREKIYQGKAHSWIVQSLYNLGELFRLAGDFTKAENYMQRALAVAEKLPGKNNPSFMFALTGIANVAQEKGEFQKAEELYRRVLTFYDQSLGANHPRKAKILTALATLYLAKNDLPAAVAAQSQANEIVEKHITLNLALGSEQKKLDYLVSLSRMLDRTLTVGHYANNKKEANEMALTGILQRKGRVLDAMSDTLSVLRRRFNPEDRKVLDELNESDAKLALLTLNEPGRGTLEEHQKRIAALEEKRDRLEIEISRRAAGFYQTSKPITLESVRNNLPENAALVEFVVYDLLPPKSKNAAEEVGEPHYAAYVVGRRSDVQMRDLGKVSEIDQAIKQFRVALIDSKNREVKKIGRQLDEKIMQPVRALLGKTEHLLISPDGGLNLIPFEALVDEQDKYLVENYSFTYLTSGRDLLRMQTARKNDNKSLIVANPAFGEPLELVAAAKSRSARDKRRGVNVARDLSETYFTPLGATGEEARAIQTLFPDATFLIKEQATESALKQIAAPRILHIATHGFFLEDADAAQSAVRGANAVGKIENPLVRSGLALAGANRRDGKPDDGILTALEASNLNLFGTKLVVLSACDTGVGEVKNGEGVYGLRRAFVLAGAESLVMSLWAVSDSETRRLMTDYYKNLKTGGIGRGAALRQAQLAMLRKENYRHPFYWAAFIQSGEWATLDGKR